MTAVLSIRPTGSVAVVEFDDGVPLRCTRDFLHRMKIRKGQQIEAVFVDRLRESAADDLALFEAERLNRRGRLSRNEIALKLQRADIPDSNARAALDLLAERGDLDDQSVALQVVRRSLNREISQNPDLTWNRFRNLQGRRLALRGFGSAESNAALRQAWAELAESPLAHRR
ncbi:MAG: RecX family transcriptional regulator [Chloroflexota bacterium]|nr:RecX family transcriptional regulator [Chloroflexota bacterium]